MKKIVLILLFLAGCGRGDSPANEQAAPDSAEPAGPGSKAVPERSGSTRLTGLYESGSGARKNQMCVVEKGGESQFGLIVWGSGLNSCSGAGKAVREGERLTLTMTGDETCTIRASLKDGVVTLPASLPTGCAYYCAASGATLANARFARAGTSSADVKKATDITGEPLCD